VRKLVKAYATRAEINIKFQLKKQRIESKIKYVLAAEAAIYIYLEIQKKTIFLYAISLWTSFGRIY
jgi:hypothetical protein